ERANPWVVLAAGASMPALPPGIDPRLRAALPRMTPRGSSDRQWTLADPGRDYLVVSLAGGPPEVDPEPPDAEFTAHRIEPRTGLVAESRSGVLGGKVGTFAASALGSGPTVLWLTRDEAGDGAGGARR